VQHIAPRLHRIGEATEAQIDRRDDLPAAGIVRIGLQVRLDLRHQMVNRLILNVGGTRRQRLAGQLRRSNLEIERSRADRQDHERHGGDHAPVPG